VVSTTTDDHPDERRLVFRSLPLVLRPAAAATRAQLCRFLGLSPGYWLRAQAAHDTELASAELADELEQIQPLVAAQT